MLKLICLLPCLLMLFDAVGYGFEMTLKNSSSFSYVINTLQLRNIEVFCDGHKITELELRPGDEKSFMFVFLIEGKNAEYGDMVLKQKGLFGCKIASLGFIAPEFSDYVVPSLNRICCLNEIVNNRKGFVVRKTFDHSHKKYILEVGKNAKKTERVDSDRQELLPK